MSEPENFLTRWSRRKRVTVEPDQPAPAADAAPDKAPQDGEPASNPADKRSPQAAAVPKPDFDPATLPSLDSIGAQTDIRAFLQAGVPSDLRLAALRRAWAADPAILNFKGLAENDWDFTATDSMRGFGELDPGTDVKKMLAQIFSETPRADEPVTEIPAPGEQLTPPAQELSAPAEGNPLEKLEVSVRAAEIAEQEQTAAIEKVSMVQREENIAAQNDDAQNDDAQIKHRRSQGSALPQ
jgi:Protein of unknown function (DUF3306)